MNRCKRCGSYAINQNSHGRVSGVDLDLCDVCYWRKRFEADTREELCVYELYIQKNFGYVLTTDKKAWEAIKSALDNIPDGMEIEVLIKRRIL
jgi:hypothetical protein